MLDDTDEFNRKCKVNGRTYFAVLLHDHPELIDDCCALINLEWKRSHTARLRSLEGSSDKFPTSVLLMEESIKSAIRGHCKLTKVSQRTNSCIFVETVVIHPDYRGQGLGKLLMLKAEAYLKRKGIEWIYLTTMEKEGFYEKLGYSFCDPITIYGGPLTSVFENQNCVGASMSNVKQQFEKKIDPSNESKLNMNPIPPSHQKSLSIQPPLAMSVQTVCPLPPPPPQLPPPPPPPPPLYNPTIVHLTNKKVFMRKKIV